MAGSAVSERLSRVSKVFERLKEKTMNMYSGKGELTSCRVCLVWYVVCRGRMYVVRCLGVSSLFFCTKKLEAGGRASDPSSQDSRPVRGAALRHLPLLPKHSLSPSTIVVGTAITTCTASHGQHLTFHSRIFSQSTTIQQTTQNAVRHFAGLGHAQPASVQIHPTGSQRGASMDRRHSRPLITAWRPVGRSQRWNRAVRAG